jgi:hypothetical protein
VVVPVEPESLISAAVFHGLQQVWEKAKLLRGDGVGDDRSGLISGGFERLRLDLPGRTVLYANQQGGFRVKCAQTGANIAAEFGAALLHWRSGGPRGLECSACGLPHALETCVLAPPGAFGASAIVFSDAGGIELSSRARSDLLSAIGRFHVVLRRTS